MTDLPCGQVQLVASGGLECPYIYVYMLSVRVLDGGIIALHEYSLDELHYRSEHLGRVHIGGFHVLVKQLLPTPPEPSTAMWYSLWYAERDMMHLIVWTGSF